ncbi:hypothetical protein [Flavobacterium sp.]|jgi:hypothetical protein|uniref:hypothetical protein n=1 Tax=Flavobacterium sp. TaxID=239 RepID=UPI0037C0F9A3
MKKIAQLLLFVFTSFLITPTIVSVFEENSDVSEFYNYSDQEKANKEIEAVFSFDIEHVPNDFSFLNSSLIRFENLSKHDKIFSKIFIPPPERA